MAISCIGFGLQADGWRRSALRFIFPPSSLILHPYPLSLAATPRAALDCLIPSSLIAHGSRRRLAHRSSLITHHSSWWPLPGWLGEPFAPEQPLVLGSRRLRDQCRHQTLPSPLSQSSLQPQDQPSHQPLPIVPHQRPLLARPLPPNQGPALATVKPSFRPPPQPRDQPSRFRLLLALEQSLVRSLPQSPV